MEWWIWSLMWVATTRTPPRPEIVEAFEARQTRLGQEMVRYRFFRPKNRRTKAKLPLLVWLHGLGEAGENNRDQLAWLELILGRDSSKFNAHRCCILATQCSRRQPTWIGAKSNRDDPLDQTFAILQEILRTERIDRRRVYLAGVSTGASGGWELARRNPGLFAAVALFAPTSANLHTVSLMKRTPVWIFQSSADGPAAQRLVQRMVIALRQVGGRVHLTMVDSADHDCWSEAFQEHHVGSWMMAQRRGNSFGPPPGYSLARFRSVAVLFAVLLVLLLGGRRSLSCALHAARRVEPSNDRETGRRILVDVDRR